MTTAVLPEVADADTFGGTFADADAVVDPETELAASYFNRLVTNVVAMSHALPRAWVRLTASASPSVVDHGAVWGSTNGVKPAVSRSSAGVYTVTWSASLYDLQATPEVHSISIRAASVSGSHSGAARILMWDLTSAVRVTVYSYDAAGAAADCDALFVQVW